ncbi:hypothetical protein SAMN05421734_101233 [Pelagirhabdus alkalitolerans]|uniref:CAAX prenyl protease 2/Lysostaphin resistance protein A-like domain-containing protein n=2 Tax=Pelagirhabdus alkalitolerans TaxID=1612202 RepID=A0A1G6GKU6_9BACI|nr:hypothetical protein SAMN05421734_101233 [Pelagirhabdus alkalitolerans]
MEKDYGLIRGDRLGWGISIGFIATYLGLSIAIMMVVMLVGLFVFGPDQVDLIFQMQYTSYIDAVSFLLAYLIFKGVRDALKDQYSLEPMKQLSTYGYIVGSVGLIYLSQFIIIDLLTLEEAGSQVDLFGLGDINLTTVNVLLISGVFIIIAPLLEEVLFRGFIFGFLAEKLGLTVGFIASSVIFGLLHPGHILSATIMGFIITGVYYKTRTLWAPILLHLIWNSIATYSLLSLVF